MTIKYYYFIIFIAFVSYAVPAFPQFQKSAEVGVTVGGSYYLGDLNKIPGVSSKLAFGAFYKHNINKRFSLKGQMQYGTLASEAKPDDVFTQLNPGTVTSFNNTFYDLNASLEYNFNHFIAANNKYNYTPYIFAGLGFMYYPKGATPFLPALPFGLGVKFNLFKNFIAGANFTMNKTFTDNLDYIYTPPSETNIFKQYGYNGNSDWYSVCGIYLSYKINYRVKCPAFD
ncbi:MAG: DUF6089 family protein [Salinivirgaceae bacterium]